jgi:Ca2+-binding RTX toxin-like protein
VNITTGAGDDTITSGAYDDIIHAGGGNDTINYNGGVDLLDGGTGIDLVVATLAGNSNNNLDFTQATTTAVNGTVFQNIERVNITTGSGDDSITAGAYDDILSGGAGNDTLTSNGGVDVFDGGSGIDLAVADLSSNNVSNNLNFAGDGTVTQAANGTLFYSIERVNITTGSGDDSITSGAYDDIIHAGGGNDTINYNGGVDLLDGGTGIDLVVATLSGNNNLDFTQATTTAANGTVFQNIERVNITTGSGDDSITAGAYDDILSGGAGNDTLTSNGGVDVFDGGSGIDLAVADLSSNNVSNNLNFAGDGTSTQAANGTLFYSIERVNITTGAGDDSITSGAYNDIIHAGGGNDTINYNGGVDLLDGGTGIDLVVATLSGNNNLDFTQATTTAANGTVFQNIERVNITTGSGDDSITAGAYDDILNGGAGNDTLNGGTGADNLTGGIGDDTYIVDNMGDILTEDPSAGIDTVKASIDYTLGANVENLTLTGTAISGVGNVLDNTILGNSSDNNLNGGDGKDTIDGGTGKDTMIGGAGNDLYIVDNAGDLITEDLSAGTDNVRASIDYTLTANVENLTLNGTANISGTGNDLDNTIVGNSGDNLIRGGLGNNTLDGGAGNDVLYSSLTGVDNLTGGIGDDVYEIHNSLNTINENLGGGTDTIWTDVSYTLAANVENMYLVGSIDGTGNSGDNTIVGYAAGDNNIAGDAGNDILSGGDGNDTLNGGTGADTMIGGTGNDTYFVDTAGDSVSENVGEGIDTVRASIDYALGANVENLTLNGTGNIYGIGNDLDNTIVGNSGDNIIRGGLGNNTLDGDAGNDVLFSSFTGIDTLTGGTGNDVYEIHNIADIINENSGGGTDTVWTAASYTLSANVENLYLVGAIDGTGNGGDNTIVGYGAGDNLIDGGAGNDTLWAGAGNDTIYGGMGNDLLYAATGDNQLDGGEGNDVLFSSTTGIDTLTGGNGDDVYEIHNSLDQIVENSGEGTDTVWTDVSYTLAANVENMYLVGSIDGTGSSGDNTIVGYGIGDNLIDGGAGNDTLLAGAGNDKIYGGIGNDALYGSTGNDLLYAGTGDNTLDGGEGNDVLYTSTTGIDTLTGGTGDDVYEIHNSLDQIVEIAGEGTDAVWTDVSYTLADNIETMYLVGSVNGTGNAGDNTIVGYGAGDNFITGGAGNDTLFGGDGNDTFVFDSASFLAQVISGVDTIGDFTATQDKIQLSKAAFSALNTLGTTMTDYNPSNLTGDFSLVTNATEQSAAELTTAKIIYNSQTGGLFYNANGTANGLGNGGQFALLNPGLVMSSSDFTVVQPPAN